MLAIISHRSWVKDCCSPEYTVPAWKPSVCTAKGHLIHRLSERCSCGDGHQPVGPVSFHGHLWVQKAAASGQKLVPVYELSACLARSGDTKKGRGASVLSESHWGLT